ncbi:MAG: cytochrome-c peroxidase [Flavobacteriales bacterium]|nr:cytochrome-c peroxidase [Flavobacteriales bacterium]
MRNSLAGIVFLLAAISFALSSCEKDIVPNDAEGTQEIVSTSNGEFELCKNCPPGFELTDEGICKLRSLYQQYASLTDQGVGGLKTALPEFRDGFTPQQIDLGRYLFFDPILSKDGTISCASCHQLEKAFSDGLATSVGIGGQEVKRGAPSLWNVAFLKLFFWDGRATTLEEQMQGPLFAENEMGTTPHNLRETINSIPNYGKMFRVAFPERNEAKIQLEEIYTALAAFQTSLISLNSRYDQYAHGFHGALNPQEIEGMNVFRSFVARCAECHTPPLFTNQQLAVLGTPEPEGRELDPGAQVPYNDVSLRAGFKIPSLRNVALTAPYMHSGRFKTLRETVEFYTKGRGHAVPEGENLYLHWHIWEPELSDNELDRLVDFLQTLTDESFMPKRPDRLPSSP